MIIEKLRLLEKLSIARGIPIIGPLKGAWLLHKVKEVKPGFILEIGTANGYSGCILGSEGAEVTTIETNEKIAEEAALNFSRFGIKNKIIIGEAVNVIKKLSEEKQNYYGLIFIDFAKKDYIKVIEECMKLVKKGGFIIADNIKMLGCKNYLETVLRHPFLETEIIEIKDGLSCSKKI